MRVNPKNYYYGPVVANIAPYGCGKYANTHVDFVCRALLGISIDALDRHKTGN